MIIQIENEVWRKFVENVEGVSRKYVVRDNGASAKQYGELDDAAMLVGTLKSFSAGGECAYVANDTFKLFQEIVAIARAEIKQAVAA